MIIEQVPNSKSDFAIKIAVGGPIFRKARSAKEAMTITKGNSNLISTDDRIKIYDFLKPFIKKEERKEEREKEKKLAEQLAQTLPLS